MGYHMAHFIFYHLRCGGTVYTAPVVAVERNGRPIFVLEQLVETLVGVY